MPPGRARRHPRLPAPGLLCRDPARQTSSRPPGRRASATGGACARGAHGLLDQANGRQIGPSSGITAARWHARRPFPPSGAAIPRHFAPVPSSPWGHRILQIPITSLGPPRVRAWAVSVRRPHATPPLGWPASENLHHVGHGLAAGAIPKPDILYSPVGDRDGRKADLSLAQVSFNGERASGSPSPFPPRKAVLRRRNSDVCLPPIRSPAGEYRMSGFGMAPAATS